LQFHPELINVPTQDGSYPLHLACMTGDVTVISTLIGVVRCVDATDEESEAVSGPSRRRLQRLAAVLNAPDARHQTPLHVAIINNRFDAVRELLAVSYPSGGPQSFSKR
jgi:ankyrin repeat protein